MAESLETFEVKLFWVNKTFQTTKTVFFSKGEDREVTFLVEAIIDHAKRFDHRIYRVHTVLPTAAFPPLSRREAIGFRDTFKAELVKAMHPYPVAQFGVAMFEGMGAETVEAIHRPIPGRSRGNRLHNE